MQTDLNQLPAVQSFENVTMYRLNELGGGVSEIVCRSLKVEVLPYAQYPAALRLTYVPKGKRQARQTWLAYRPFLVVLQSGSVTPENYLPPTTANGVTVTKAKYLSCDPRYLTDFLAKLAASGLKPLLTVCSEQDQLPL